MSKCWGKDVAILRYRLCDNKEKEKIDRVTAKDGAIITKESWARQVVT